jgi:hypothetical protein
MARKAPRESADLGLVFLGLIAWVAAFAFGAGDQTVVVEINKKAPKVASAGAACGFAIAGGLCFVGAVLAARGSRDGDGGPRAPHSDTNP